MYYKVESTFKSRGVLEVEVYFFIFSPAPDFSSKVVTNDSNFLPIGIYRLVFSDRDHLWREIWRLGEYQEVDLYF